MPSAVPVIDRLMRRLVLDVATGCLNWTGCINEDGYGVISVPPRGKNRGTHIVAYEEEKGPVPEGLELDHTCENRRCCNLDHLEPVTHLENVRRGRAGLEQSLRTHCPQGHAYDEANTCIKANGKRRCRTCQREAKARYYAKRH